MKIFAMMCSHRKNKNTQHALEAFLEGFEDNHEVTKRNLIDMNIKMCIACEYCSKHRGECVHKDDMKTLIDEMHASDLIIIASPLYFNSATTIFKTMIDRTQILYNARYVIKNPIFKEKKPVLMICIGGAKTYGNQFEGLNLETEHFLKNINGKVIEYIKYNNTDRFPVMGNEEFAKELHEKAKETEVLLKNDTWDK